MNIGRVSYHDGDILCETAFVNAVNTVGTMGKGLARQVAARWPECVAPYQQACWNGTLGRRGAISWKRPDGGWIVHAATKTNWRQPSTPALVKQAIEGALREAEEHGIAALAFPRLGCGLGGLEWETVHNLLTAAAAETTTAIRIYGRKPEVHDHTPPAAAD